MYALCLSVFLFANGLGSRKRPLQSDLRAFNGKYYFISLCRRSIQPFIGNLEANLSFFFEARGELIAVKTVNVHFKWQNISFEIQICSLQCRSSSSLIRMFAYRITHRKQIQKNPFEGGLLNFQNVFRNELHVVPFTRPLTTLRFRSHGVLFFSHPQITPEKWQETRTKEVGYVCIGSYVSSLFSFSGFDHPLTHRRKARVQ